MKKTERTIAKIVKKLLTSQLQVEANTASCTSQKHRKS